MADELRLSKEDEEILDGVWDKLFAAKKPAKLPEQQNPQAEQYARLADAAQARGDHASARIYRRQAEGG